MTGSIRKKSGEKTRGQTVLELVVAVGLFTTVALASGASLLSSIDSYRKTSSLRTDIDNLSAALESMVRGLKTGYLYWCGDALSIPFGTYTPIDCTSGGNAIAFEKALGDPSSPADQVYYYYDAPNKRIMRRVGSGVPIALTSPSVEITSFKFYVTGSKRYDPAETPPDTIQPRIIVVIKGKSGKKAKTSTDFSVQTTISQRKIDLL